MVRVAVGVALLVGVAVGAGVPASQASPTPSPSVSTWLLLPTAGQLSIRSCTWSVSLSVQAPTVIISIWVPAVGVVLAALRLREAQRAAALARRA